MKYHVDFELELKENPYPGLYIALEGIDGSGKTTQAEELAKYYKSQGRNVLVTAEPSREGEVGELVHKILQKKVIIPKLFNQYLFAADRGIHQENEIIPALKAGKVVISDRNFWSGLAYGLLDKELVDGKMEGKDQLLVLLSIFSMYHQFMAPDLTVYLKVDVDTAVERIHNMERSAEIYENREMIEKVEKIYEWMAEEFKDAFVPIDGNQHIDTVTAQILKEAEKAKEVIDPAPREERG